MILCKTFRKTGRDNFKTPDAGKSDLLAFAAGASTADDRCLSLFLFAAFRSVGVFVRLLLHL